MITYYCPECWSEITGTDSHCPKCGFELAQYDALSFEKKLVLSLEHPILDMRLQAIHILGDLGSLAALPGLEKLLDTETKDIYALREALEALSKIQGTRSREILQKATQHPFPIIRQLAERLLENRPIDSYD